MYSMSHHYPPVNGGLGEHGDVSGTINPAALDAPGKFLIDNSSPRRALCAGVYALRAPTHTTSHLVTSVASSRRLLTCADHGDV